MANLTDDERKELRKGASPAVLSLIDEVEVLREICAEYTQLMAHMDSGGDFFEFQASLIKD